jgi:hypothetical protein
MDSDDLRRLQQFIAQVQQSMGPPLQAIAKLQEQIQPQLTALAKVQQQVQPQLEAIGKLGEQLAGIQLPESTLAEIRRLQGWFAAHHSEMAAAMEAAAVGYRRAIPDNLLSLELGVAVTALQLMSEDDGMVLVWLPPGDIVEELVRAGSMADREAILIARASEIAAAAIDALDHVDSPRMRPLSRAVTEAWASWQDGYLMAAQALATAALGTVVHDLLSYEKFAQLKNEWLNPEALDEWPLIEIRYGLLMYRTAVAVERTDVGLPGYNRHGSAHKVDPAQYTEANALHSLMLVTAWARELQALDAREHLPDA